MYIFSWLSSCRIFWICTRYCFLSGKYYLQCVILIPRKIIQVFSLHLNFFNGVVSNKVRQTSAPNSHKCKPSPEKIRGQQPKGKQSLQKYVRSHLDGPSSCQTGDDGIGVQLVCLGMCYMQKATTLPVWVLFINLCDDTPVFLIEIVYQESNVIQRMTPCTNVNHSRNPTKVSYLV